MTPELAEIAAIDAYRQKHSTCNIQQHPWPAVFGAGFAAGRSYARQQEVTTDCAEDHICANHPIHAQAKIIRQRMDLETASERLSDLLAALEAAWRQADHARTCACLIRLDPSVLCDCWKSQARVAVARARGETDGAFESEEEKKTAHAQFTAWAEDLASDNWEWRAGWLAGRDWARDRIALMVALIEAQRQRGLLDTPLRPTDNR